MEKQIAYKNWEATFSTCFQLGDCGNMSLPFSISWWSSNDVLGNQMWDFGFFVLCFSFHVEIWKWNKKTHDEE